MNANQSHPPHPFGRRRDYRIKGWTKCNENIFENSVWLGRIKQGCVLLLQQIVASSVLEVCFEHKCISLFYCLHRNYFCFRKRQNGFYLLNCTYFLYLPEGERPFGRPRSRWENNIKMDLQGAGGGCGDWMDLAQDGERWRALVSTVRNFRVP
jgi:hypothetical protein